MHDGDDPFDDVYDGKFDIDPEMDLGEMDPADSRAMEELVEEADPADVDVEALVDVGVEYVDINRFEQAVEAFERAIHFVEEGAVGGPSADGATADDAPQDATVDVPDGPGAGAPGDAGEGAGEVPDEAVQLAQEAWVNKGFAHAEMGEHDRALGAYREAIAIDDSTEEAAMALTNTAYAKWEDGRAEDALHDLNRALEIDEKRPEAWYNKGFFLNQQGRYEDALRSFDNAVALGLRNADLLDAKAEALEGLERHDEAEALREEARERRDQDVERMMRE